MNTTTKLTEKNIYDNFEKEMDAIRNDYLLSPSGELAAKFFNTRMNAAIEKRDALLLENNYGLPTL